MKIMLRVFICSPLVAKGFAAECLEDPTKQEEDLEAMYQYIVVCSIQALKDTLKEFIRFACTYVIQLCTTNMNGNTVINSLSFIPLSYTY